MSRTKPPAPSVILSVKRSHAAPIREAGEQRSSLPTTTSSDRPHLIRRLGLFDCTSIVVGIVIGSGIFLTPGIMASHLPSPVLLLLAWVIGGAITIAGALSFAELGAAMPASGGQYVYLKRAYGEFAAFLFGWISFTVHQSGAIAAVAVGFALYLGHFVPQLETDAIVWSLGATVLSVSAGQIVACIAILVLTIINVRGLKEGSFTQNLFTLLKLGGIGAFILLGFWAGDGGAFRTDELASPAAVPGGLLTGLGLAMVAVLWTFDGWNNLTFSGGEIRDPGRTLPRGLFVGVLVVTIVYLLTTAAYLYALPISEMQGETRIAQKAATVLFGPAGASLIALTVVISTIGAANGVILTAARVYYAMAKDGLFFASAARVHPRFHTPHLALWLQCAWACALAVSGTFYQLITYAMFAALLTYAAAAAAVFMLRVKEPRLARPYRTWGYPVVPALFLLAVGGLVLNTLIERPLESFAGLGIFLLGVPVYLVWRRRNCKRSGHSDPV